MVVPPRNNCKLIVVKTRDKSYPLRSKAHPGYVHDRKTGKLIHPLRKSRKNQDRINDPGGRGKEIVAEKALCSKCAGVLMIPQEKEKTPLETLVANNS
ncbi:MAG: hypothetical protein ACW987_17015 [Candidatus Thorarchaeota archaeon]